MAAHGLQENAGLLGFVVAAKVAMVGIVLPLGVLLTLSYTNGNLAPNREHAAVHMPPWPCVSCAAPEVAGQPVFDEGGPLIPVTSWAHQLSVEGDDSLQHKPPERPALEFCLTICGDF